MPKQRVSSTKKRKFEWKWGLTWHDDYEHKVQNSSRLSHRCTDYSHSVLSLFSFVIVSLQTSNNWLYLIEAFTVAALHHHHTHKRTQTHTHTHTHTHNQTNEHTHTQTHIHTRWSWSIRHQVETNHSTTSIICKKTWPCCDTVVQSHNAWKKSIETAAICVENDNADWACLHDGDDDYVCLCRDGTVVVADTAVIVPVGHGNCHIWRFAWRPKNYNIRHGYSRSFCLCRNQ